MKTILTASNAFDNEDISVEFSNDTIENANYVEMTTKIDDKPVVLYFQIEELLDMAVAFENKRKRVLSDGDSDLIGQ